MPPVISRHAGQRGGLSGAGELQRHRLAAALADMGLGGSADLDLAVAAAMRPEFVIDLGFVRHAAEIGAAVLFRHHPHQVGRARRCGREQQRRGKPSQLQSPHDHLNADKT
jgi:hypothetical protein